MQKYVIALYIRLSLEDYKYDSMSIENQHLALNEFVSSMPESANAEVLEFIDNGYSGTNFERPKVQELIEMVRANKIDCIIVKDFSRFGRNSIGLHILLIELGEALKGHVHIGLLLHQKLPFPRLGLFLGGKATL